MAGTALMRRALPLAAAALVGCATGPQWPAAPRSVTAYELPPHEILEECAPLAAGDRFEYAFESTEPVDFNLHYHEGKAVLMPLSRERTRADAGVLPVAIAQEYCAMWEAGPKGALIDYRLRIRRAGS
jgi:hypothetical protein